MQMIVISEKFKEGLAGMGYSSALSFGSVQAEVYGWSEAFVQRLSDYEIVVVDLQIPVNVKQRIFGLWPDISRQLSNGGVVIALTFFTRRTGYKLYKPVLDASFKVNRYDELDETNYDWLNAYALHSTRLDREEPGTGKNFELISQENVFQRYFEDIKEYHKTIMGIKARDEDSKTPQYVTIFDRDSLTGELVYANVKLVAITKVTSEAISCIIDYGLGSLIFIPQANIDAYNALRRLCDIGEKYYKLNIEKSERPREAPLWLVEFVSEEENRLLEEIKETSKRLNDLRNGLRRFERINSLLYEFDKPLETAVQHVFEKEWDCATTKMPPGSPVDFKVLRDNVRLVLEVTGDKGKIFQDNKKFGQLLAYLPNAEPTERIVLLCNTYRDTKISERPKENFTQRVIELAGKNEFCLMTTWDLFRLWKDSLRGRSLGEIILTIYNTKGEYQYTPSKG